MAGENKDSEPHLWHRLGLHRLTTPGWLRAVAAAVVLAVVLVGVVTGLVLGTVRAGFEEMGQRSAPLVSASADLYFALSDLDAQVANQLLVGSDQTLGSRQQAQQTYNQRRVQADGDLDRIAALGGDQDTVHSIMDRVGQYQVLVAQALWVNATQHEAPARPSAATLGQYDQATKLMRGILTDTQALITANHDILNQTYATDHGDAIGGLVWVVVLGVLALVLLAALQSFLRWRLRRRLNPGVAVGTVLVLALVGTSVGLLTNSTVQLQVAKQDAFDSVIALSQARAVSYDANADESRYLVDPGNAAQYQQAFLDKSQSLLTITGAAIDSYASDLDTALADYQQNNADVPWGGDFGAELNNITFPGERDAANAAVRAFQAYQADDHQMRGLNESGDLLGAIRLDVGTGDHQSDKDFADYDNALVATININQRAFDQAIADGTDSLSGWTGPIPAAVVIVACLLVIGGIRPRLAEYRR